MYKAVNKLELHFLCFGVSSSIWLKVQVKRLVCTLSTSCWRLSVKGLRPPVISRLRKLPLSAMLRCYSLCSFNFKVASNAPAVSGGAFAVSFQNYPCLCKSVTSSLNFLAIFLTCNETRPGLSCSIPRTPSSDEALDCLHQECLGPDLMCKPKLQRGLNYL